MAPHRIPVSGYCSTEVIDPVTGSLDIGAMNRRRFGKIVAVIDRLEGARANIEAAGYMFESLFTTKDLGVA